MKRRNKSHVRNILDGTKHTFNSLKAISFSDEYDQWFRDFASRYPKIAGNVAAQSMPELVKDWKSLPPKAQAEILRRTRRIVRRKAKNWVREAIGDR